MAHELHTNDLNIAPTGYGILKGSNLTKNFRITNPPPYRPSFVPTNPRIVGAQNIELGVAGASPQLNKEQPLAKGCKNCGAPIHRSNDKQGS